MRLGTVSIGGNKYPACFSARIMLELESEGGSVQEKLSKIADSGRMSELLPILHKMLVSGHRYAERHGIENPGEISYDDFVDDIGPDDFDGLFKAFLWSPNGHGAGAEAGAGDSAVWLIEGVPHTSLKSIGTSGRKHLVDSEDVERMEVDADVISLTHGLLHVTVGADTGSLESLV